MHKYNWKITFDDGSSITVFNRSLISALNYKVSLALINSVIKIERL